MRNIVNKNAFKYIDWITILIIAALVIYSLIAITNALADPFSGEESSFSEIFANLNFDSTMWQGMFFLIGVGLMILVMIVDYNNLRFFSKYLYWICIGLLVAVYFFGSEQRGTTGWFMIGNRGFQPSEFTKIALILVISKTLADQTEGNEDGIRKFSQLFPVLWRFAIPFMLVAIQPDLGTALVFLCIFIGILFMAKISLKMFLILVAIGAACLPILWFALEDYQRGRIFSFMGAEEATADDLYQSAQAKLAIGSGGVAGKGLFASGSMAQLGFVPERQNDFIFAATTETFGFIGAFILILLYALLIIRTFMIALRAKDDFGTYICIGVMSMILFHVFENIGMNIGIMPITGISLPFFSYGGSNLLVCMISYGLVLNVDMRRQRWTHDRK